MPEYGGISEMVARIGKLKEDMKSAASRGVYTAARNVLDVSNRTVPFEEGDLSRDGAVSLSDGDGLKAAISYGRKSDTKDYAVRQHEDLTLHHDAGRGPKYLENAINSQRETTLKIVGEAAKAGMEGAE